MALSRAEEDGPEGDEARLGLPRCTEPLLPWSALPTSLVQAGIAALSDTVPLALHPRASGLQGPGGK